MPKISKSLRADVEALVKYNWDDERDDYEECANGSGNQNGVFPLLVRLRNWLTGERSAPADFIAVDSGAEPAPQ